MIRGHREAWNPLKKLCQKFHAEMVMDAGETECATLEKYMKIGTLGKFKGIFGFQSLAGGL